MSLTQKEALAEKGIHFYADSRTGIVDIDFNPDLLGKKAVEFYLSKIPTITQDLIEQPYTDEVGKQLINRIHDLVKLREMEDIF